MRSLHLAAISNDPVGELDPEVTYDINYRASVRLAELAREAQVPRFLFSSSCSLYGAAGDAVLDESAEFSPVTAYARSKVLAEEAIAALASDASARRSFATPPCTASPRGSARISW